MSEMEIMAGVEDCHDKSGTWLLEEATRKHPWVAVARALVQIVANQVLVH